MHLISKSIEINAPPATVREKVLAPVHAENQ
jgi:hypothetical protein